MFQICFLHSCCCKTEGQELNGETPCGKGMVQMLVPADLARKTKIIAKNSSMEDSCSELAIPIGDLQRQIDQLLEQSESLHQKCEASITRRGNVSHMMNDVVLVCLTDKDQKPNSKDVKDSHVCIASEGVDLDSIKLNGAYVHISAHECMHNKQIKQFPDQVEAKHQSTEQSNIAYEQKPEPERTIT
ncbi:unnamed protein product [Amaranthus hypochondriacus]